MTLNLTAMIDVIFLLLIYFVVTAIFTPGEGIITANLPKGTGTAAEVKMPEQPINIVLTALGLSQCRVEIHGRGVNDFLQLYEQLVQLQYDESRGLTLGTHRPDDPVIIKPQGDVRWQHVVNAFNAGVRARYKNIQFAPAR